MTEEIPTVRHSPIVRVLVPALLLVAAAAARADERAPRLVFDQKDFLFEKTIQGTKVVHGFSFRNAGDAELIIRKVETSCGCTVGKVTKDHLAPGETGSIELVLDTKEKVGAATLVRATVYSNDAKENAIGPCTTLLELKGEVVTSFIVRPAGAWFGQLQRGGPEQVREVRVYGDLDAKKDFKIEGFEHVPEWLRIEARPLDPPEFFGELKGWALKVTLLGHVPAGEFLQHVTVKTDVASQPTFRFPVVGIALNAIRGMPEAITFERVRRGNEVERVVQLERVDDKKGFRILSIDYDRKLLEVTPVVVIEGVRTDLQVKLRKDAPPGVLATELVVRLDEPGAPLVRWPVFADVRPRVMVDPPLVLVRPDAKSLEVSVPVEGGTLTAAKATPEDAFSVSVTAATKDGRPARVVLTPKRALQPGEKASLVLESDVPGEEKTTVPIEAPKAP